MTSTTDSARSMRSGTCPSKNSASSIWSGHSRCSSLRYAFSCQYTLPSYTVSRAGFVIPAQRFDHTAITNSFARYPIRQPRRVLCRVPTDSWLESRSSGVAVSFQPGGNSDRRGREHLQQHLLLQKNDCEWGKTGSRGSTPPMMIGGVAFSGGMFLFGCAKLPFGHFC